MGSTGRAAGRAFTTVVVAQLHALVGLFRLGNLHVNLEAPLWSCAGGLRFHLTGRAGDGGCARHGLVGASHGSVLRVADARAGVRARGDVHRGPGIVGWVWRGHQSLVLQELLVGSFANEDQARVVWCGRVGHPVGKHVALVLWCWLMKA